MAEDDILYSHEHFHYHVPEKDVFSYNMAKWSLFTWTTPPIFSFRNKRKVVNSLIAKRDMLVDALEERFNKYPNHRIGELGKEVGTVLTRRKVVRYCLMASNVFLSHVNAIDPYEQKMKKRRGFVRAYDIPHWGKPEDILKHFI